MSNSRKRWGTASKVLSTALSAALVVAFAPAVAWGEGNGHLHEGSEGCEKADVASIEFNSTTTYYENLTDALTELNNLNTTEISVATLTFLGSVKTQSPIIITNSNIVLDGSQTTQSNHPILNGDEVTGAAALSIRGTNVKVMNLTVDGPDTDEEANDDDEFGIAISGNAANQVTLQDVKIMGSNAAIRVDGPNLIVENDLSLLNNGFGGVCVTSGSLDMSNSYLDVEGESAANPTVSFSGDGAFTPPSGGKLHIDSPSSTKNGRYYKDPQFVSNYVEIVDGKPVAYVDTCSSNITRTYSLKVPETGSYRLYSDGCTEDTDLQAWLYPVDNNGKLEESIYCDDIGSTDRNFEFIGLDNDQEYRLVVGCYSDDAKDAVNIKLICSPRCQQAITAQLPGS